MTAKDLAGTGEAAARLGMPRWRLQYLIERGDLPEPSHVVAGRRLFTSDDLAEMQTALLNLSGPNAENTTSD